MTSFFCPHCGQLHKQGARFCSATGKLIQAKVDTNQPVESAKGLTGKLPPNHFLRDRFIILDKIGQGGMAAVYRAVDSLNPGTLWAIKEMSDSSITDPEERNYSIQAFQQEANLLSMLKHPNLPKVMDVFSDTGKYYFVMEFIHGHTLQELLLNRNSPFDENEVLTWALQLCDVLDYLHSQTPKIIFRDLKPSNIMLTNLGQVKLIDFGIVRFFKPGKTRDTVALGTPGYASPESLSGQTDERSDIYSLCVTMHHLLSMHDPVTTIFNLPPIRKINPMISPDLERIIMCGVQNPRDRRWQSISQLQRELIKLLSARQGYTEIPSQIEMVASSPAMAMRPQEGNPVIEKTVASSIPAASISSSQSLGSQNIGGKPQSASPTDVSMRISRPTTRLVHTAANLSGNQFSFLIIFIIIGITEHHF